MKVAFLLVCMLNGLPSGQAHFASINSCDYFKNYLDNQTIRMGEETRDYDCYCKFVNVNKDTRLY